MSAMSPSRRPNPLFREGAGHHAAGRLDQAYALYRRVIAAEPGHVQCHFNMGVLTAQIGRNDLALDHVGAAIALRPGEAKFHLQLGMILADLDRSDEAVASYRLALSLQPNYAEAHNNLANILGKLGHLAEAERHFRAALALDPTMPEAHGNLGYTLNCLGRPAEAAAACRQALQCQPDYAAALDTLGTALVALGRFEEAEASYRRLRQLVPDLSVLHKHGAVLTKLRRSQDAAECYREILRLKPDDVRAWQILGDMLDDRGRREEAVTCYREVLRFDPDQIDTWNRLGGALALLGRQDEAVACYDEALQRKPDAARALVNRCVARLPLIYRDEARIEQARADYDRELAAICRLPADALRLGDLSGIPPYYLAYQGRSDRDLQARYGGFVASTMAALYPAWTSPPAVAPPLPGEKIRVGFLSPPAVAPPLPGEKIRVGFLSPYFRNHSNWKIPLKGWLSGLDKGRFQIFGYHLDDKIDDETAIAETLCHRFVQGPMRLELWAETIRGDGLHVLIIPGIGLDAMSTRLAGLRLAPVQATSWGHPNTTGLPSIDHYLSAALMEPANGDAHYTERLIRLPNLSIFYEPPILAPAETTRAELDVPEDAILYWCCQTLFKYLPRYDWIFPHIAAAVPQACFLFLEYGRAEAVTAIFRERLAAAFAASGLDAARHCRFVPPLSMAQFGAVGRVADVFLDSLGWSGCNTTLEALANDLPVVTMAGELMRGRHGSAILTMLGMPDMIAATPEEFTALAIRLGSDPQLRRDVRRRIARDKHRLYRDQDAIDGLARYLEAAACGMAPDALLQTTAPA
jgi:protein O-GlcNAc transferase